MKIECVKREDKSVRSGANIQLDDLLVAVVKRLFDQPDNHKNSLTGINLGLCQGSGL